MIRFALTRLNHHNEYHVFERLCLDFAKARISPNFVSATGPVGAGGDQGRDFETFVAAPRGAGSPLRAVGICSLTTSDPEGKVRSDLAKVAAGEPVDVVYAFLEADMPVAMVHRLTAKTRQQYGFVLEVFDGNRLAEQLAAPDLIAVASRWLAVPSTVLRSASTADDAALRWADEMCIGFPRSDLHGYLEAVRRAARHHVYQIEPFAGPAPALDTLYQPQDLVGVVGGSGQPVTWHDPLARDQHLVITGPAGVGKSSLLRHIAGNIATGWLSHDEQAWLPILIHARDLAEAKPLAEALHAGAMRTLAANLMHSLPEGFFDGPPLPQKRWLVLVDGLDELRTPDDRAAVARALDAATRNEAWQIIVVSRPLASDDLAALPGSLTPYALQPFDHQTLRRFVDRWFGARDMDEAPVGERVLNHVTRHDLVGWAHTPLIATMLCALTQAKPAAPLPNSRAAVYAAFTDQLMTRLPQETEPVIAALQDRIIELLEHVAFQRQSVDQGGGLLDHALKWAVANLPAPPERLKPRWPEIVRETLCRTGLIVVSADELIFSHASVEEYFAARMIVSSELGICEFFDGCDDIYVEERGYFVFSCIGLIGFVADLTDADATVSGIIKSFPAAAGIVETLYDRPLGTRTVAALTDIADGQHSLEEVRIAAASALNLVSPGDGVPYLLELSTHPDIKESDRWTIVQSLIQGAPAHAAAVRWLIYEICEEGLDFDYLLDYGVRTEAMSSVTGLSLTTDDQVAGLRLIATTPRIPDRYRVAACADLADHGWDEAYSLLRTLLPIETVMMYLSSDRQGRYEAGILRRLALDPELSAANRFTAANYIEECWWDAAHALYRELSQCPELSAAERAEAAAFAQALDY